MKIYAKNKKAKFDYEFLNKYEAGISLLGTEVKSIKEGGVDLSGSYIVIDSNDNPQWLNGHINKYQFQTQGTHEEKRTRQLLLKKREIKKISNDINLKRLTVIPYIIYANHRGNIKLEFYTAKGKNVRDKRSTIKQRDLERESRLNLKNNY